MPGSARRIVIEFLGEDRSLGKTAASIEGKTSTLGSKLKTVAKVAGAALVGGVVLGGKALFDMGQKAGDLNETISKTQQIFGGSAASTLEKWAKGADVALGMSQQTALDAASTFGVFGKSAGKTGMDLARFSKQNTQLAADLASFHNTTPEEAIEALGAAFRGEAEPMRRFGVLLDDASMRQQALKMGLIETTTQALTPQQKVLSAQALIMKQTSDAQGDFTRTSGGLANQQRILKAQFENVQIAIGQKVLPFMLKVATFTNATLIPALGRLGSWLQANVLPALQRVGSFIMSNVVPALQRLGGWIRDHVLPIFQRLGSDAPGIFDRIRAKVAPLVNTVIDLAQSVGSKLRPIWDQLVATFRSRVAPTLEVIRDRFQEWQPTITRVVGVLGRFIGAAFQVGAAILGRVLPPVIRFAGFLLSNVVPAVLDTIGILGRIVGVVVRVGTAFINGIADIARFVAAVGQKIGQAINFVQSIPGKVKTAVGNLGSLLWSAGSAIIQGLIDGVQSKISALTSKLSGVTKLIPKWKGPLDKDKILLKPAGVAIMEGLIAGIDSRKQKLTKVLEKVTEFVRSKREALTGLIQARNDFAAGFRGFSSSVFGADTSSEFTPPPVTSVDGEGNTTTTQPDSVKIAATVDSLFAFQQQQQREAEQLRSDVASLLAKGLSRDLVQQMAASGSQGIAQIRLLATASAAQVQAFNASNAATQSALHAAGMQTANALMEAEIKAAEREVAIATAIETGLDRWSKKQDKNTIVKVVLDGREIHASLLQIKRKGGKKLELD